MTMTGLDWSILLVCVAALSWFSLRTVKYMRGAADFLSANRSAGRYMLALDASVGGLAAVGAVGFFEQYFAAGFPPIWWMWMTIPAGILVTLTGWVYYRFRETRCLTLAQFFQVRYSRGFRIFAGMTAWLSGILNFILFPYVASNFFVYFIGLSPEFSLLGLTIQTYWPIMLLTTGMAALYTTIGGQITVAVTDCVQGMFVNVMLVILIIFLLVHYAWPSVIWSMKEAPTLATLEKAETKAITRRGSARKIRNGEKDRLKYPWEDSAYQSLPAQLADIGSVQIEAEEAITKSREQLAKATDELADAQEKSGEKEVDRSTRRAVWKAEAEVRIAELTLPFTKTEVERLLREYELILAFHELQAAGEAQRDATAPELAELAKVSELSEVLTSTSEADLRELVLRSAEIRRQAQKAVEDAEGAPSGADVEKAKHELTAAEERADRLLAGARAIMMNRVSQVLASGTGQEGFVDEIEGRIREIQATSLEAAAELSDSKARSDVIVRADSLGKSMLNPFDTGRVKHFGFFFFLIMVFNQFYGGMSWQGSQAYRSSGLSPHEHKMGQIIFWWLYGLRYAALVVLAICALTFLTHPDFAGPSAQARQAVEQLRSGDTPQLAVQQRVPIALAYMLPTGLRGLFCVMMVFLLITTQDTYLHSWGTIFIQDVVMPFRKKPFTSKGHVNALRWSIVGVAVFSIFFACLYKPTEFIMMYFAITGAIISGLGCAIVGGLYWKYGGTLAAYVAVALGGVLSVVRIVLQQYTEHIAAIPQKGPVLRFVHYVNTDVTSQVVWFWIMLICIVSYVVLSLILVRKPFDLNRMLHRGKYDIKDEHKKATDAIKVAWLKIVGITEEFTHSDRILAIAMVSWNFIWVSVFVGAAAYNFLLSPIPGSWWTKFWHVWLYSQLAVGLPTAIAFLFGGVYDLRRVFKRLSMLHRDERDDGRVIGHHLAADEDTIVAREDTDQEGPEEAT